MRAVGLCTLAFLGGATAAMPRPLAGVRSALADHLSQTAEGAKRSIFDMEVRTKATLTEKMAALDKEIEKWAFENPAWVLEQAQKALLDLEKRKSGRLRVTLLPDLHRRLSSVLELQKANHLMQRRRVSDLSGSWTIEERHNMNTFLKDMGFNAMQRAAAIKAGQVQVIRRQGENLHIVTRDLRGTYELVLPLNGRPVDERTGDECVTRRAWSERGEIVITETLHPSTEPFTVCRRSLDQNGRMHVDVAKRTKGGEVAKMRIVYTPLDHEHDGGAEQSEEAVVDEQEA